MRKLNLFLILFSSLFFIHLHHVQAQVPLGLPLDGYAEQNEAGWCVTMPDPMTVAYGTYGGLNPDSISRGGYVKAYRWNGSDWTQKGATIIGSETNASLGYSVEMPDSNTLAVGAPFDDNGGNIDAGEVKIFRWDGIDWVQKGSSIQGSQQPHYFGMSLSMPDSNTIALSYNNQESPNSPLRGGVCVYDWNGSDWVQRGSPILGEYAGDNAGYGLSMPDINTLAIGSTYNDDGGINAGHARVFEWNGSAWVQKGTDIDGRDDHENTGRRLSMPDANTIAVGNFFNNASNNFQEGHVRMYTWDGTAWVQKGNDLSGDNFSAFGTAISMPDPNTVGVGAFGDGNGAMGSVEVFRWNGSAWVPKVNKMTGINVLDYFGWYVDMADSNYIAVGACRVNSAGTFAGQVQMYRLCNHSFSGLAPTACNSYTSPSGKVFTSSGIYSDTLYNVKGCDSLITINLTITPVDTSVNALGDSLSANLTGATYQWVDCDNGNTPIAGATGQSFQPLASGNYAVEISANGCTVLSPCYSVLLSNIHRPEATAVRLYPNPSKGIVNIELDRQYEQLNIRIHNTLGQEMRHVLFAGTDNLLLDLPRESGLYFVSIFSGDVLLSRHQVIRQ